jgi:cytidylate kinase
MQGDLLSYLRKRYEEMEATKEPGPVITISREYGCPAKPIAAKLAEALSELKNSKGIKHSWKWYSKEILDESAKQLKMDPAKIKYVFDYEKKGSWEDFFNSFSGKYYHNDRQIRNTIGRVVREIGEQGHSIIVGRGSIAITRDIPRSLHINLEAPIEWRAIRISERYNLTFEKAKEAAIDTDKKRKEFRDYFQGKNTDYTVADATFNCMTLSVNEIVELIVEMVKIRGFY